jgi:hypothetical protein
MGIPAFIRLGSAVSLTVCTMAVAGNTGDSTALDRLRRELDRLNAAHGNTEPLVGDALPKLFPAYDWYEVTFRQFPVARMMPPPLKAANIFAVPRAHGEPLLINTVDALRDFFRDRLAPVRSVERARDAAHAWLQAAAALHQDGFYRFAIEEDSIKAHSVLGRIDATGKAIAMRGGNGSITVALSFDSQGKLHSGTESAELHPGPRPICQATKLLDGDPIVRKIAEQDLLIMGSAAKSYLDEARMGAKPELRRAIDRLWDRISREDCPAVPPRTR